MIFLNSATAQRRVDPDNYQIWLQRNEEGFKEVHEGDWLGFKLMQNHTTSQAYDAVWNKTYPGLGDNIMLETPTSLRNWIKEARAHYDALKGVSPEGLRERKILDVNKWVDSHILYGTPMGPTLNYTPGPAYRHGWRSPDFMFKYFRTRWTGNGAYFPSDPYAKPDNEMYYFGDNKDFVLLKAVMLHMLGVPAKDIVIVVGMSHCPTLPDVPLPGGGSYPPSCLDPRAGPLGQKERPNEKLNYYEYALLGVRRPAGGEDWVFLGSTPARAPEDIRIAEGGE